MGYRLRVLRVGEAGFTLMELMVVIAIIGVLASIAIPNFQKFQAKARQKEAQLSLAAVYEAQISNHGERATFTACLNQAGFRPEGDRRFYTVGFNAAVSGSASCFSTAGLNVPCDDAATIAQNSGAGTKCHNDAGVPTASADVVFGTPIKSTYNQTAANMKAGFVDPATSLGGAQLPGVAGDLTGSSFTAGAIGNVGTNPVVDTWTINERKILTNTVMGVL